MALSSCLEKCQECHRKDPARELARGGRRGKPFKNSCTGKKNCFRILMGAEKRFLSACRKCLCLLSVSRWERWGRTMEQITVAGAIWAPLSENTKCFPLSQAALLGATGGAGCGGGFSRAGQDLCRQSRWKQTWAAASPSPREQHNQKAVVSPAKGKEKPSQAGLPRNPARPAQP